MLQEFIPGGQGHDWFFHGYCDANSVCQPAFTGVKERSYPAAAGLTSLGRSVANEKLRDEITSLLARARVSRTARPRYPPGRPRPASITCWTSIPRLGAQFRIFRDTAGTDVALAAYLDLTDQADPAGRAGERAHASW